MFQLPPNISGFKLLDTDQIRHIYACHYESSCCKDVSATKFDREKYNDEYKDGYLSTFEPFDVKGSSANPPFSGNGNWKKNSPPFLLSNNGSTSSGELYSLSDRPAGIDIFTTGYEEKIIGKISGWWKDVGSYNGEVNAAIDASGHLYMWGPFSSYNAKDQFQNWAEYIGLDPTVSYVQRPKFERVDHKTLYGILDCSISGISSKDYNTNKYTSFKISDKNFDVASIKFTRSYCGGDPVGTGCLINPRYRYHLTSASLGGSPIPGTGCEQIKFRTIPGSSIQTVSEARYIVDLDYRLTKINILSSGNDYTFLDIIFSSKDASAVLPSGDCQLENGRLKSISFTPGNGKYVPSYKLVGDGIGAKILLEWEAHPISLKVLNKGHYSGMDPVKVDNSKFLFPWEIKKKDILDIVYGSPNNSKSILYSNNRNYNGIYATVTGWDVINSGSGYTSRFDSKLICSNNLGKYVAYLNPGPVKCISTTCECDDSSPSIKNFNNDNLNHTVHIYGQLYGPIEGATATKPPSGWKGYITDGEITSWFINWGYTPEPSLPPPWTFSILVENPTYVNLPLKSWSAEHPILGGPISFSGTCNSDYLLAAYVEPTFEIPTIDITYGSEHYDDRNRYSVQQGTINRKVSRLEYDYILNNVTSADPDKLLYETKPLIKEDKLILVKRTQTWEPCADTRFGYKAFCETSFTGKLVNCFPPPSGLDTLKNSIITKKPKLYTDVYYRLFEQFSENEEFQIRAGVGYEVGDSGTYTLDNLGDKISHIYFDVSDASGVSGVKGLTFEPEIHVYNYPILPLKVDDGKTWNKIEVGMNMYDPDRESYSKSYNYLPIAIDENNKPWILTDYLITPLINREIYTEHVPYYTGILPYNIYPYSFFHKRMHCYKDGSAPETSNINTEFFGTAVDYQCGWTEDQKYDPFDCVDIPNVSWFPGPLRLSSSLTFICGCFYPDTAGVDQNPAYKAYWEWVDSINITNYPSIFFSRILGVAGGLSLPEYKVVNNAVETIPTVRNIYTTNSHFQWIRFDYTLASQDWVPVVLEDEDGEVYHTRPAAQFPPSTPSRPLNLQDHIDRKRVSIERYVPSAEEGFTGDASGSARFSIIPNPNLASNGLDAMLDRISGGKALQINTCESYGNAVGRWPRGRMSVGPPSNQIIEGWTKNNICANDTYNWRRSADHGVHSRRFGVVMESAYSYPEYDDINFEYNPLDELLDYDYYIPLSRFLPVPKLKSAEFNYDKLSELWGSGVSLFTCRDYIFDGNIMGGFFPSFWFPWAPPLLESIIILKDLEQLPQKSAYRLNNSFSGTGQKICHDLYIECCTFNPSNFPPSNDCEAETVQPVSDQAAGRDDYYWAYPTVDFRGKTPQDYLTSSEPMPYHTFRWLNFKVPAWGDCNPFAGRYPPPGTETPIGYNCYVRYPVWGPVGYSYPLSIGFERMLNLYWNADTLTHQPWISFTDRENYGTWHQKIPADNSTPYKQNIVSRFSSQWGSLCSYTVPSGQGENYYDTIDLNDFRGNDKFKPVAVVPFKIEQGDTLLYLKDHGEINFEIWRLFEGISRTEYNQLILENRVGDRRWQKYAIPWITGITTIEWHEQGAHDGSLHRFNMDFWLEGTDRDMNRSASNQFNPLLYIDKQNEIRNGLFYWSEPQDRVSIYRHGSGNKIGGKIEDSIFTMYDSGNNAYFNAHIPTVWQVPNYFANYIVAPSALMTSGNPYLENSGIYVSGLPDNGIGLSMPGIPVITSSGIPTMIETVDLKYSAKVNQIILENTSSQTYTTKPLVYIDPPSKTGGITAEAECEIEGPFRPILVDSGEDYTSIPYLDFIGSGIPPVIDQISIENGQITDIICTMDGLYRENPDVVVVGGGGNNAIVTGIFTGYPLYINITNSGDGYEYPPNVFIESQGYSSGTILNNLSIPEYELLSTTTRAQATITGCLEGSGIPADCVIFNKWSGEDPKDTSIGNLYYHPIWGGNLIFHDNISEYTNITELTGILKLDDWYYGPKYENGRFENPLDALKTYVHDCNEGLRLDEVNQMREIPEDPDLLEFTPFPNYNSTSIPIKPSIAIEDGGVLFVPSRLKRLRIVGEVGPNSKVESPTSSNKNISVSQLFSKQIRLNSNALTLQKKFTLQNIKWSKWPDIRIYDVAGSGAIISGSLNASGIINSIYFSDQGNHRYTKKSTIHFADGSPLFLPAVISGTLDTKTSGVKSIVIKNSGEGYYPYPYDNYSISIEHNTGSGLEILAKITQGPVPSGLSEIRIINPGSGYSSFPKITIENNDLYYPQKLIGAINLALHTDPSETFKNISDFPSDYIPNIYRDKPKYLIDETKFNISDYYYRHNGIADVSMIYGHKGMNKFYHTNFNLPTLNIVYPSGYHQTLNVEFLKYPTISGSGSGSDVRFMSSDKLIPTLGSRFDIYKY